MAYDIPGATRREVAGVDGIALSVFEAGPADGLAVLLSHGFPELAYSWRHQLGALGEAGYHVIAPDQRGYGGSGAPSEVTDYDIFNLTGDLAAVLDALGHERAVVVGHDWGGLVVWQMALLHPDRVGGVVGVNTPYFPRFPIPPTELFRATGGENHYILFFQTPGVADAALAADVRSLFTRMMRTGVDPAELQAATGDAANFVEAIAMGPSLGQPVLGPDDLDVFVSEFDRTGFTGGLNWYRNFDRNWEQTAHLDGARIDVPCLMVTAEWDPVLTPAMATLMQDYVADLETHMIPRCGHWTQQEHPNELDALLLDWLARRFPA